MGQYHHLIAGLPDITLEDSKQVYSVYSFKREVNEMLSRKDRVLLSLFFLKYDNLNLLNRLENRETEPDNRGTLSEEELNELHSLIPENKKEYEQEYGFGQKKISKKIPTYFIEFLKQYQENPEQEDMEQEDNDSPEDLNITKEDILSALYYKYAIKSGNRFISQWFEMNLNIKNILTAITCKRHNLDKNLYIIGDNSVAKALRTSNAKDYNLGDEIEYLPAVLKLAEESDLVMREKRIDILKWDWLEYNTIFKVFGIESVFAYLLKIEMIERWTGLDKATGENTFRELITTMKRESNSALEEFKKNNKR